MTLLTPRLSITKWIREGVGYSGFVTRLLSFTPLQISSASLVPPVADLSLRLMVTSMIQSSILRLISLLRGLSRAQWLPRNLVVQACCLSWPFPRRRWVATHLLTNERVESNFLGCTHRMQSLKLHAEIDIKSALHSLSNHLSTTTLVQTEDTK
jgi:hypothetical protein